MNNQEIQNELLQVQKEIAELPAGYLEENYKRQNEILSAMVGGRQKEK